LGFLPTTSHIRDDETRRIDGSVHDTALVMARYSHKGNDTIRYHTKISRYDTIRYDTIRKCFTVCKNGKQAGNSAQHWSTVVLPINTVAAAGAWILADWRDWRGDGRGRRARRPSAGGRCSLKSRVIQQGYCEYWPPNNSSCGSVLFTGDSPQLLLFGGRTARRFGGRTAGGRSHGSNI